MNDEVGGAAHGDLTHDSTFALTSALICAAA
jgi:hypothetical protein